MSITRFGITLAGLLCTWACGSGSSGNTQADGAVAATCADVASNLCGQAAACAGNGTAPVMLTSGGNAFIYESAAYCAGVFSDQCGPAAPASDVPLVRDPVACGRALSSAMCVAGALLLPAACGGH
jgi:hypothetical protein